MNDHTILIFIKTIQPYCKEINNILGYPDGFEFRVRYRQQWVALDQQQKMTGCKGLILLHSTSPMMVVPVRKVIISDVVKIGTLTFISMTLGEIVEFSSDPQKRIEQIENFQVTLDKTTIRRDGVFPVTNPVDLTEGLVDQDYTGDKGDRILNNWGNLIEILGEFECYRDYDFLKFVNLSDETGTSIFPQINPSGLEYPLVPGKGYTLSLLQVIPRSSIVSHRDEQGKISYAERENRWLEIRSPSPDINLLSTRFPVTSRYDIHTFRFDVKEIMGEKISAIGASINTKTALMDKTECEIILPIRLHNKPTWHAWRILNITAFLIGGIVLLVPELMQTLIPSIQFVSPTGGITSVQKFAIVILVLTSWSFPKAEKWLSKIMGV